MKSKTLQLILLSLSLFVLSSISYCQQDSTDRLSFYEFKAIGSLLYELEYRRTNDLLLKDKVREQSEIIVNQKNIIAIHEIKEENFKDMIKEIKVPWYNRFWIGATAVIIIEIIIYMVLE